MREWRKKQFDLKALIVNLHCNVFQFMLSGAFDVFPVLFHVLQQFLPVVAFAVIGVFALVHPAHGDDMDRPVFDLSYIVNHALAQEP